MRNYSQSDRLVFIVAALIGSIFAVSVCSWAQQAADSIWPAKAWQTSSPEKQGMDSKELAKLVEFGATHNLDSLLVLKEARFNRARAIKKLEMRFNTWFSGK